MHLQVGVIDEVQLLGDPLRGASYTRAILGLPAKELHLCGDAACLPLLKVLAEEAGDLLRFTFKLCTLLLLWNVCLKNGFEERTSLKEQGPPSSGVGLTTLTYASTSR